MTPQTPDDARLLAALSDELSGAREDVQAVEVLIALLIRQVPAEQRGDAVVQAQMLDALNQRLDALAAVLRALSQGVPAGEALDRLPLADLAARLRPASDLRTEPAPASGDLTLF